MSWCGREQKDTDAAIVQHSDHYYQKRKRNGRNCTFGWQSTTIRQRILGGTLLFPDKAWLQDIFSFNISALLNKHTHTPLEPPIYCQAVAVSRRLAAIFHLIISTMPQEQVRR
jgi:hypothetical protein